MLKLFAMHVIALIFLCKCIKYLVSHSFECVGVGFPFFVMAVVKTNCESKASTLQSKCEMIPSQLQLIAL